MKRKLLCISLVLACCLTACGGDTAGNGGQGTESGSGQEAYGDVPMEELRKAVVDELGEDYWPNMAADAEVLYNLYGISEDMYDSFLAELPMISTNVDTLIIIKAKEGQEDDVEAVLNAYRDRQINESVQYPINVGKVQASRIETIGSYVCFIQLGGDVTDLSDQGDDAVIEHCQEHNERALEAIRVTLAK